VKSPRIRSLMQLGSGSCASMRVRTMWDLLSATGLEIADQKAEIESVFPRTRTLISVVCRMNRENIRTPARSISNLEFHHTTDETNEVGRRIVSALEEVGIAAINGGAVAPRFCRVMSAITSRMRSGALVRYNAAPEPAMKCVRLHTAGWWICAFSFPTSAPGPQNPTLPSSVSLRARFQRRAARFSGTVSTKHANAPELALQRRSLIWNARCRRFVPSLFSGEKLP
jgi:hypothetical protein